MYCRDHCTVTLLSPTGDLQAVVGYAMAEGDLSLSPDTGLRDGQTVQVTGRDLMSTYHGPTLLVFPTGGWVISQCDRAILDQPSLFGFFTHCVVLGTRAVTIDGSTLDTTWDVQATITKILGGTTDCTASPGACVVGLARFEQDASLSTHFVPVGFG